MLVVFRWKAFHNRYLTMNGRMKRTVNAEKFQLLVSLCHRLSNRKQNNNKTQARTLARIHARTHAPTHPPPPPPPPYTHRATKSKQIKNLDFLNDDPCCHSCKHPLPILFHSPLPPPNLSLSPYPPPPPFSLSPFPWEHSGALGGGGGDSLVTLFIFCSWEPENSISGT